MTKYREQIQRVKDKLLVAKKADKKLKVFGANSHKYKIGQPATDFEVFDFENKYSIQLSECYRGFITQVGSGSDTYEKSAAGPFYGIYPLGENIGELICGNSTKNYLKTSALFIQK